MALNLTGIKNIFKQSKETTEGVGEKERKVQKELFVYPADAFTDDISFFRALSVVNTAEVKFNIFLPADFSTLDEAVIVIRPDTTETIDFDINVSRAKKGEVHSNSDTSDAGLTKAVIQNEISEIDITTQIEGAQIERGDYLGIQIVSNQTAIQVLGLRWRYS